jgi:hypothetical protein
VNDILLVCNKKNYRHQQYPQKPNEINPKLQFTIEKEKDSVINFLNVTVIRNPNNVHYDIYRKPTTTDNIIHNTSCHPTEHKMLAMSYLIHRINTYPTQNKTDEENVIKHVMTKKPIPQTNVS